MARYYSVQRHDSEKGWEDLRVYSTREKLCEKYAFDHSSNSGRVTRIIRKPHSFEPGENDTVLK